jgi:hypothetical protein
MEDAMRNSVMAVILGVALVLCCGSAHGRRSSSHADNGQAAQLGRVEFPVSCAATVQSEFSTGVAYLHSFQYSQAQKTFEDISKRDPKCAMAYWGLAMSLFHQLWDFPNDAALKKGYEYAQKAKKLGGKTPRERAYIAAAMAFYQKGANLTQIGRTQQYSTAMEEAFSENPDDVNAGAFYALSLVALAQDGVNDLGNRKHAIAILQQLFAAHPDNPGVDHYLIHASDTPQLAPEALAAARNYAKIAPDSAHALHMPSHIFTRLGYWQDSIDSNKASAAAAEKATRAGDKEASYQLHAMTYLQYAYLQRGEDQKARQVTERVMQVPGDTRSELADEQALFRITYAMETHDWKAAASMELPPHNQYPSDHMDLYWARTIGAARLGNAGEAKANLMQLQQVFDSVPKPRWRQVYLRPAYLSEAEAWTEYAEGNAAEAEKTMREAVTFEKSQGAGELAIPAEEMLGDLLLAMHRPALAVYEDTLKENPNRFNSLYGAAQAAKAEEMPEKAKSYLEQLVKMCAPDADRPELKQAERSLSSFSTLAKSKRRG